MIFIGIIILILFLIFNKSSVPTDRECNNESSEIGAECNTKISADNFNFEKNEKIDYDSILKLKNKDFIFKCLRIIENKKERRFKYEIENCI